MSWQRCGSVFFNFLQKILFTLVLHSQDDDHIPTPFIVITDGVTKRAKFHLNIVLMRSVRNGLMDASPGHQTADLCHDRSFCFFPGFWAFTLKEFM